MSPPTEQDEVYLNACGVAVYTLLGVLVAGSLAVTVHRRRRRRRRPHPQPPPLPPSTPSSCASAPALSFAAATARTPSRDTSSSSSSVARALLVLPAARLEPPEAREAARIRAAWHAAALLFAGARAALLGTRFAGAAATGARGPLVCAAALLRRTGELLRFTMYTLVAYWWAALYARVARRPRLRPAARALLAALNAAAYLLTYLFSALWIIFESTPSNSGSNSDGSDDDSGTRWDGGVWYELATWTVLVLGVVLQGAVPLCAAGVYAAQPRAVWVAAAERRDVLAVAGCSAAYLLCGALHALALLARTLLGHDVRDWVCYTAGYFVPETLETLLGLRVLHTRPARAAAAADSALLQQLYASAHGPSPLSSSPQPPSPPPPPSGPSSPVPQQQPQQQQNGRRHHHHHRRAASTAAVPHSTAPATSLVHSLTPTRPHRALPHTARTATAAAGSVNPGDGAWRLVGPAEPVALSPSSAAAVASTKRHQHRSVYGANVADPAAGSLFDVDAPALPVLPLRTTTSTSSNNSAATTPPPPPPRRPELHTH